MLNSRGAGTGSDGEVVILKESRTPVSGWSDLIRTGEVEG